MIILCFVCFFVFFSKFDKASPAPQSSLWWVNRYLCIKAVDYPFKFESRLKIFKYIIWWICCSLIMRSTVRSPVNVAHTEKRRKPGMHLYARTLHLLWLVPSAHIVCVGKSHTHTGCCRLSSCTFPSYTVLYLKSVWEYYVKAVVRFWALPACSAIILFYRNNYSAFSIDSHDPLESEKWEEESYLSLANMSPSKTHKKAWNTVR